MATTSNTSGATRTLIGVGVVVAMLFGLMAITGSWRRGWASTFAAAPPSR